ncbi:MAG: hypothetical protein M1274_03510, partial [Actinobacteria bacterium]|nr:hypothetical protein [Actinomycetota bacterium]
SSGASPASFTWTPMPGRAVNLHASILPHPQSMDAREAGLMMAAMQPGPRQSLWVQRGGIAREEDVNSRVAANPYPEALAGHEDVGELLPRHKVAFRQWTPDSTLPSCSGVLGRFGLATKP